MAMIRTGSTSPALTDPLGPAAFAGKLADVDQSFYTVRGACERPVPHDACDRGINGLTGLKFAQMPTPTDPRACA